MILNEMPYLCLLAPALAIILSFITKKVHLSLAIGVLAGFVIVVFNSPEKFSEHIFSFSKEVFFDFEKIKIIIFTVLVSLMVSVMIFNGSIGSIANRIGKFADSNKKAQLMTWFTGLIIFFDDYANTLIVGNTLRPITDKYRVSREKLAYIVDGTAAPVAAIALVSTWIGYEVNQISISMETYLGQTEISPYVFFIQSLKYSYYPILTLIFIFMTINMEREFGPMLKAKPCFPYEIGEIKKDENKLPNFFLALLPVILMLLVSLGWMVYSGYKNLGGISFNFSELIGILSSLIGAADGVTSLLIGSLVGFLTAQVVCVSIVNDRNYIKTLIEGVKKILDPLLILILAWSLGHFIAELETADFIINLLPDETTPYILPGSIFIVSAIISFATGSSFSTMGIMYPIALPLVLSICQTNGLNPEATNEILFHGIAVVLAGSVFGDHCSPISDTTILSSLASKCDHIQHVKTQLPYALSVGGVSIFLSFTLANVGIHPIAVFIIGILILYMILKIFGSKMPKY